MRAVVLLLLTAPGIAVRAEQEIHRCPQADGTVAFQETPCPETADTADLAADEQAGDGASPETDGFFDFVNPFDNPEAAETAPEPEQHALPSRDRAECEKLTRDAIDAIDLELQKGHTEEEGRQYLAELLELTRQLRACKLL